MLKKTYFRVLQTAPDRFWLQKKEGLFGKWCHIKWYGNLDAARQAGQGLDFKPVAYPLREDPLDYC